MSEDAVSESFPFDLLVPRPSSDLKLAWAWSDLGVETKIAILKRINEDFRLEGSHKRTLSVSWEDPNQYVRYIARSICPDLLNEQNRSFDSEIISPELYHCFEDHFRYSRYRGEVPFVWVDEDFDDFADQKSQLLETFPKLPYLHQIALLSGETIRPEEFCQVVEDCLRHFLDKPLGIDLEADSQISVGDDVLDYWEKVSNNADTRIWCLVKEYVRSPRVQRLKGEGANPLDGYDRFTRNKELKALWELVVTLTDAGASELIDELPRPVDRDVIGKEFVESLSEKKRRQVFWRNDIPIDELRIEFFEQEIDKEDADIDLWNIDILNDRCEVSDEVFGKIFRKAPEVRNRILDSLVMSRANLSLSQLAITRDVLRVLEGVSVFSSSFEDSWYVDRFFSERLETLSGSALREEVKDFRIYSVAKAVVPWESENEPLQSFYMKHFSTLIAEGDTWKTFLRLKSAIKSGWQPSDTSFDEDGFLFGANSAIKSNEYTDEEIRDLWFLEPYKSDPIL